MDAPREGPPLSGWVPHDRSIHTIVRDHLDVFAASNWVLISCIDSHRRPGHLPFALRADPPVSQDPFVLSGAQFAKLVSGYRLFTGFDEIWLAPVVPAVGPPEEASLVYPVMLESEALGAIAEWMAASQCVLGLGDGWGVNFVATDPDLVAALELKAEA